MKALKNINLTIIFVKILHFYDTHYQRHRSKNQETVNEKRFQQYSNQFLNYSLQVYTSNSSLTTILMLSLSISINQNGKQIILYFCVIPPMEQIHRNRLFGLEITVLSVLINTIFLNCFYKNVSLQTRTYLSLYGMDSEHDLYILSHIIFNR